MRITSRIKHYLKSENNWQLVNKEHYYLLNCKYTNIFRTTKYSQHLYTTNRKHKQIIVLRTAGAEYIITHELHNNTDYRIIIKFNQEPRAYIFILLPIAIIYLFCLTLTQWLLGYDTSGRGPLSVNGSYHYVTSWYICDVSHKCRYSVMLAVVIELLFGVAQTYGCY